MAGWLLTFLVVFFVCATVAYELTGETLFLEVFAVLAGLACVAFFIRTARKRKK